MNTPHVVASLSLVAFSISAFAGNDAHEHGRARLSLVQDDKGIAVTFESPLDNLTGFEHAPRTQAQRHALAEARAALQEAARVVVLPDAAGCALVAVEVALPFDAAAHAAQAEHADHAEHADALAEYTFTCDRPSAVTQVSVGLFRAFARLRHIDAEAATAAGQGKALLSATQATWKLPESR